MAISKAPAKGTISKAIGKDGNPMDFIQGLPNGDNRLVFKVDVKVKKGLIIEKKSTLVSRYLKQGSEAQIEEGMEVEGTRVVLSANEPFFDGQQEYNGRFFKTDFILDGEQLEDVFKSSDLELAKEETNQNDSVPSNNDLPY